VFIELQLQAIQPFIFFSRLNLMRLDRKYFLRWEILFFVAYFIVFGILTDVEFNLYENHNGSLFYRNVPERLIYGIVYMIPFWICYRFLIWKYLLKNRYFIFFVFLISFLVALNFYLIASYWLIAHLGFLPAEIKSRASTWLRADVPIRFSVVYVIRELLVIACLGYFIRSLQQQREMSMLKEQQLSAELQYLRIQLEPHFFFNTLNNIYAHTLLRSEQAAPLVAKYADMMRYILYESSNKKVLLQKEVAFLENYTEVEKQRFDSRISISFDSQGIGAKTEIEPLLLLPFVENAFKHGLREQTGEEYVKVVICQVGEELILQVSNSKSCPEDAMQIENGIGLDNVIKRLDILYPEKYSVDVTDNEMEYLVCVTLQLS
jgi:sensor histidine kinase YesM